jgi:lipoprotein-releasing system permease protein
MATVHVAGGPPSVKALREGQVSDGFAAAFFQLCRSPWTRWIGGRYLRSKKNSRFLNFITWLSVGGIGIGVCALIVVLSVMDGFERELRKRLMSSDLHILATPRLGAPGVERGRIAADSKLESGVRDWAAGQREVEAAWPILATEAILKSGRKVSGVVVKGVSDARLERLRRQVTEMAEPSLLVEQDGRESLRLSGVYVGQELAHEFGIIPGDRITLISPTETEGPMSSVPRMKRFVVEGVYKSGLPEQELQTVFTPVKNVQSFLRKADVISQYEVTLKGFDEAASLAPTLSAVLGPGWEVKDWVQMNSHLFASLRLERFAMFTVLAFIVIVASFNIITTLTLMVLEKKREIAILKAMGARSSHVAAIFLAEGLGIGLRGVIGGTLVGLALCAFLRRYELIELPDVFYDKTLPVSFQPGVYLVIALLALLIVLLACQYPSRRAARLAPLQGIRG